MPSIPRMIQMTDTPAIVMALGLRQVAFRKCALERRVRNVAGHIAFFVVQRLCQSLANVV